MGPFPKLSAITTNLVCAWFSYCVYLDPGLKSCFSPEYLDLSDNGLLTGSVSLSEFPKSMRKLREKDQKFAFVCHPNQKFFLVVGGISLSRCTELEVKLPSSIGEMTNLGKSPFVRMLVSVRGPHNTLSEILGLASTLGSKLIPSEIGLLTNLSTYHGMIGASTLWNLTYSVSGLFDGNRGFFEGSLPTQIGNLRSLGMSRSFPKKWHAAIF